MMGAEAKNAVCTAVVLAAGRGTRMGISQAKQYLEIGGKPVLAYALEAFQQSPAIDGIVLVTDRDHMEYCRTEIVEPYGIRKVSVYAEGGQERYESVWNALKAIAPAPDRQYVFIHDGARPFVTPEIIGRAYKAVQKWKACVVGMPVKDTIKVTDADGDIVSSPDRRLVWMAQTPQVFELELIREALRRQLMEDCSRITDDAMVVERQMGVRVHMVEGSYENIKITTPEDLDIAKVFAKQKRTGRF